jgi:hypothetical protein
MTVVKKPIKDNNVITWEMAAYDSTEELYADINTLNDKSILSLREEIDSYIDSKTYLDSDGLMKHAHKNRWAILSTNALRLAKNLDITYLLTSSEILNTVIKKQRDYGHKNISKFGITGLVIRVHDKVARVENLMKKENYINAVSDETMLDTLMDIIGYSIIAYMWLNNTFMYELGEKK